jgi:hypothetical protein
MRNYPSTNEIQVNPAWASMLRTEFPNALRCPIQPPILGWLLGLRDSSCERDEASKSKQVQCCACQAPGVPLSHESSSSSQRVCMLVTECESLTRTLSNVVCTQRSSSQMFWQANVSNKDHWLCPWCPMVHTCAGRTVRPRNILLA